VSTPAAPVLPRCAVGRGGLQVTRLIFGAAPIGGLFEPVSAAGARATLAAAWAAGIRAFDTAPHYGVGLSEQRLGSFLAGQPRRDYVLSTKVGRRLVPADGDVDGAEGFYGTPRLSRIRDYSRDGVLATMAASLERLGTDRIDIALIHDPDDHLEQALDCAYPALAQLRSAGVIGAVGVGMNDAALAQWFVARADLDVVLVAGRYSLLDARAGVSLLPECRRRGIAVLVGGVFNGGFLADPRAGGTYDYRPATGEVTGRAGRLAAACARYGLPLAAVAMQFVLRHPAVTAAVIGARTPAEITQDAGYLTTAVPDELWAELTREGLIAATPTGENDR
jgi:D-threo-aldose 1-dehydrogenase